MAHAVSKLIQRLFSSTALKLIFFLSLTILVASPDGFSQRALAIDASTSRQFSTNNIIFFNGDGDCVPTTSSEPGSNVVKRGLDTSRTVTSSEYAGIKEAAYSFMGRYLEITQSGTGAPIDGAKPQYLTKTELAAAQQAGVEMFIIFEWNLDNPQVYPNSYANGARDAQIAQKALNNLGLPASTPVYYSLDRGYNPSSADPTHYATLAQEIEYFKGIKSVANSISSVGAYASKEELLALKEQALIGWLWHAKWKDQVDSVGWGAHMHQVTGDESGAVVAGVPIDYDYAYTNSFGQIKAASSSTPQNADINPNAVIIWNYFIDKGLSPQQVAGILGNIQRESNFDPSAVYKGGDAYNSGGRATGIVQWTNGRKQAMLDYAEQQGKPWNDLGMQLDYVWIELTGAYNKSVLEPIRQTSTVEAATEVWLRHFEIPCWIKDGVDECVETLAIRIKSANEIYAKLAGTSSTGECPITDISQPQFINLYEDPANMTAINAMDHGPITPDIFVIHFTVGPQEGMGLANYFANSTDGLGVQFSIGSTGKIYAYYPMDNMRRTAHAREVNNHALGVEIAAKDGMSILKNPAQFKAVVSLAKYVCDYYKMPCSEPRGDITNSSAADSQGLLGHSEAPSNDHSDPDTMASSGGYVSMCTNIGLDRTDASTHAFMIKLRRSLGYTNFIEGSQECAEGGSMSSILNSTLL